MRTDKKLVAAAAALLDSGGESAVTLRAVASAVGVSHNAPYKHFEGRSALLAAVAIEDFTTLTAAFASIRSSQSKPMGKLKKALETFVEYGRAYPARYKLMFSDPNLAPKGDDLESAAMKTFLEFAAIVKECQTSALFPEMENVALTGILFSSVHGLIDLAAGGRMRKEKGFSSVGESVDLLLDLISRGAGKGPFSLSFAGADK